MDQPTQNGALSPQLQRTALHSNFLISGDAKPLTRSGVEVVSLNPKSSESALNNPKIGS